MTATEEVMEKKKKPADKKKGREERIVEDRTRQTDNSDRPLPSAHDNPLLLHSLFISLSVYRSVTINQSSLNELTKWVQI